MNEIKSVKISGQGYSVDYGDGTIWSVSVDGCGYDKVFKWLSEGNTPEPEFTEEELQITSINKQIQEAKTYLTSTDFYMTVDKYAELDEARKVELTTKRAEAREVISTLEAELETIGAE